MEKYGLRFGFVLYFGAFWAISGSFSGVELESLGINAVNSHAKLCLFLSSYLSAC